MLDRVIFPYKILIKFSKSHSRKHLYNFTISAIKKYCDKDQYIINIGAGGEIKSILFNHGLKFKEIDIDEQRKPDFVCSIEDMSIFQNNSVDIFFCMEVLEHVKNPFNAIKEIQRVLKPGGIIIGSTPFVFPIHDEPYDFYRYTKYGLRNLFQDFECIDLIERNSYIESIYVILLRLLNIGNKKQKMVGILLSPLYFILLPFMALISFLVTNKQSTTGYFFIFKKRL